MLFILVGSCRQSWSEYSTHAQQQHGYVVEGNVVLLPVEHGRKDIDA